MILFFKNILTYRNGNNFIDSLLYSISYNIPRIKSHFECLVNYNIGCKFVGYAAVVYQQFAQLENLDAFVRRPSHTNCFEKRFSHDYVGALADLVACRVGYVVYGQTTERRVGVNNYKRTELELNYCGTSSFLVTF